MHTPRFARTILIFLAVFFVGLAGPTAHVQAEDHEGDTSHAAEDAAASESASESADVEPTEATDPATSEPESPDPESSEAEPFGAESIDAPESAEDPSEPAADGDRRPAKRTNIRFKLKGLAAFVGHMRTVPVAVTEDGAESEGDPRKGEMDISGGAEIDVLFALAEDYVEFGAFFGTSSWTASDGGDLGIRKGKWLDLGLKFNARLPFYNDNMAVYLGVPIGLSITTLSDGDFIIDDEASWGHGVGVATGAELGLEYWFHPQAGLVLEAGWSRHTWSHSSNEGALFNTSIDLELDAEVDQIRTELGFVFSL